MSSIDKKTGEVISHNSFIIGPSLSSEGKDFSNDIVEVYELKDFVVKGPSGEDDDFTIEKRPILVDKYHLNKVVEERAKGTDIKSIIARVEQTGDVSILSPRKPVYGDAFSQPSNLSDALQHGVETASFIDSLSESEKEQYMKLAKMSKSEYDAYIASLESSRNSVKPLDESIDAQKGEK